MTEDEYINATNLAKVRAAQRIVADISPFDNQDEADIREIFTALCRMQGRLEISVKVA